MRYMMGWVLSCIIISYVGRSALTHSWTQTETVCFGSIWLQTCGSNDVGVAVWYQRV